MAEQNRKHPLLPLTELKKDKRVKLSQEQKEEIRSIQGKATQSAVARFYKVSPGTIHFIWHPEKLKKAQMYSMLAHEKYKNTDQYKKIQGRKLAKYAQKKKAEKLGLI